MALIVYGIKNCNTVKSALDWLRNRGVEFDFHDFKARGISETRLREWSRQIGWARLVNKRGTTWRQLPPSQQDKVTGQSAAIDLMKDKTSVIKRPVIEASGKILAVGFSPEEYEKIFI